MSKRHRPYAEILGCDDFSNLFITAAAIFWLDHRAYSRILCFEKIVSMNVRVMFGVLARS